MASQRNLLGLANQRPDSRIKPTSDLYIDYRHRAFTHSSSDILFLTSFGNTSYDTMADRNNHHSASERSPLLHTFPSPEESGRPASRRRSDITTASATSADDDDDGSTASELRLLASYSLPLIATYLLQYSFFVITTIVAGHLGPDDLAAESIGIMTMNVVGLAIFEGMATALDTLCAQAYGSGNLVGVGLHIQRMLVLMALSCVPIGIVWATSPWFLPLFLKQPELAVKAGSFLRYSLVGLPGYAAFEALKRFLQAQGECNVGMVVLIVCAPVNAVLSWLFAFPLGMGLAGAALGTALSNNLRFVLLLLYIVSPMGTWSHGCWGGFSRDALRKWGPMLSLSAAGAAATLAEWGAFEILIFSTSYLSTEHLAAQTVLVSLSGAQIEASTLIDHEASMANQFRKLDCGHCDCVAHPLLHQCGRKHPTRPSHWRRPAVHGAASSQTIHGRLSRGRSLRRRNLLHTASPDSHHLLQ